MNTFEASFATIFGDTLDNPSEATQKSYGDWADGYDACTRGLPCHAGASTLFVAGYGRAYSEGERS